jgi:hypothetical protein
MNVSKVIEERIFKIFYPAGFETYTALMAPGIAIFTLCL